MTEGQRLQGRVALITGMATGVGRAGAQLFAHHGAAVVGLDAHAEGAQATVDDIRSNGGEATFVHGDVARSEDVRRSVRTAVAEFGRLDALWANAGTGVFKTVTDTSEHEWDRIIDVNVKGVYLLAYHGLPELVRAGGGTVVATGSVNSYVAAPRWAAYSASKGAVLQLCRAIALDYAGSNIRANCICPGSIETPLLKQSWAAGSGTVEEAAERDRLEHPLGRIGRPEVVAQAAVYLTSDESSYITGSALMVDGGFTAQ